MFSIICEMIKIFSSAAVLTESTLVSLQFFLKIQKIFLLFCLPPEWPFRDYSCTQTQMQPLTVKYGVGAAGARR